MEYKTIALTIQNENTAMILMNQPESLNALSGQTIQELMYVVDELEKNNAVRIVIITGEGKAFAAGADIAYMSNLGVKEARKFSFDTDLLYDKIHRSGKVYIAAVNGFALGGGCELALACDLCIASEYAKFGLPEVSLGILPGGGGTQRLCLRVGVQKAKEMIFTGEYIRSEEALKIGLVLQTASADELLPAALKLAERILKNAPLSVKYAKECIRHYEEPLLLTGIEYENALFGVCFATEDQSEGMSAFLEKRKPIFEQIL